MTDEKREAEGQPGEQTPTVAFTHEAAEKLTEVIENHPNPVAGLRLQILGRSMGQFQHVLSLVEDGAQVDDDLAVETDAGIRLYIERRSAEYLDGVEIHYAEREEGQSGLEYHNPNPIWRHDQEWAVQRVLDEQINPAIAAHGGYVNLLGVEEDTAYVEFGGGCQGCGMVAVTLKQGVEVAIKEQVPGIEHVVDSTDHASGTNPYYKPSKK